MATIPYNDAMAERHLPNSHAPKRATRQDGDQTRAQLLDVAGRLFAERGYLGTSSKDICLAAGVNMAAVNYHFGSRDGLYGAVLVEAHRQVVSEESLLAFARAEGDPRDRVRSLIAHFVAQAKRGEESWGFRVVLRELMAPSPMASTLVDLAIAPKAGIVRGLLASLLRLPADHPTVQRAVLMTVVPCIAMLLGPEGLRSSVLPALSPTSEGLVDDIATFVLAGLDALARPATP